MQAIQTKTQDILIHGRRWFQRSFGNTYHTVEITNADGTISRTDPQYGYGDQYLKTAFDELVRAGYIPAGTEYRGTQQLRDEFGIRWLVSDVNRQRDL